MVGGQKATTKKMDGQLEQMQNLHHMKNKILQIAKACIIHWKKKLYQHIMKKMRMEFQKNG